MKNILTKLKELAELTLTVLRHQQSVSIQRRLLLYCFSLILAVFAAILLILNIAGVFSSSDRGLNQVLSVEQRNIMIRMNEQTGILTAQGVSLSEQISRCVQNTIFTEPISVLNNDPDGLLALERQIYPILNTMIRTSPCNGIFVVLDATTNTQAPGAETSRAGMYLRFANLNSRSETEQDLVLYRGIPTIAREQNLQLGSRWDLEMDSSWLSNYDAIIGDEVTSHLSDNVQWLGRMPLPDTWEEVFVMTVPILGSDGKVIGLCGFEISDLYFRLSYPGCYSEYGTLVSTLTPMDGNKLLLEKGMIGGAGSTSFHDCETLDMKIGRYFNTYTAENETFLGLSTPSNITIDGLPTVIVIMVDEKSYSASTLSSRLIWIFGSLLFLAVAMGLAWYLSKRFLRPIFKSIEAIKGDDSKGSAYSGIIEIDELIDFVQSKASTSTDSKLPPNIEELLGEFTKRVATLTPMERVIFQYYIDGLTMQEVASTCFISISTVKTHNTNIYRKLSVSSRDELMLYVDLFRRCGRMNNIENKEKTE